MNRVGLLFVLMALNSPLLWSQISDTSLNLKAFEVVDVKPSENYRQAKIDSITIQDIPSSNLDEILKRNSDLFVKDYGRGALSTPSFRGMGANHTRLYWNNIALNSSMNGTFDFSLLSATNFSSVELHYGAGSMIDGAGSLGGSVKLITDKGFNRKNKLSIAQTLESFGTYRTTGSATFSSNKIYLDLNYSYYKSENNFQYLNPMGNEVVEETMEGASYFGHNGHVQMGYSWNERNQIEAAALFQYAERNLPKLNFQKRVNEFQTDQNLISYLSWNRNGKNLQNEFKAGVRISELNYKNFNLNLNNTGEELDFFAQERMKYQLFNKISVRSSFLYDYIKANHQEYSETKMRHEFQMIHDLRINPTAKTQAGLVLKTHLTTRNSMPILPSLNFGAELFKHWLKTKAIISFHGAIPTLNDLYWGTGGNPNLKPETGWSYELNLEGKMPPKNKNWTFEYNLGGYFNYIENWILWIPNSTGLWTVENVSEVHTYGIEARINSTYQTKKVKLGFSPRYNFNISREAKASNYLVYVPQHRVNGTVWATFLGYRLSASPQWISKRYINSSNTSWLPPYSITDVSLTKTFKLKFQSTLSVSLAVINAFDNPYQNIAHRPNPGRYFSLTLKYTRL